jgi:hypothetical protein
MILLNPNVVPLLKKRFGFSDEVINTLRAKYAQAVINLVVNNSLTYLEENHKEEEIKRLRELSVKSKQSETVENVVEITKEIYMLPGKYPELAKIIKDDISELNSSMFQDFCRVADDELIKELLEIGAKELEDISHIPA